MRLSDSEALLARALTDLDKKWNSTGGQWNDRARTEFDRVHLEEFRTAVREARNAMKNVDMLLRQVIKDCS